MKEVQKRYVCSECGHTETKWMGRCAECNSWNTFEEEIVSSPPKKGRISVSAPSSEASVRKLSEIRSDEALRLSTGFGELDRVLGGGVMLPSSVLIGGEPGIGKSTLMLEMLSFLSSASDVLYVSGEESPSQVKMRGERLGLNLSNISIFCDTRLEVLEQAIEKMLPRTIIVDSLQTLYSSSVTSIQGSVNQIRTCCLVLSNIAKRLGLSIFFVGHVTKDGAIAGPKIVEHMVDTVLYFESAENGIRLLRAAKNRFGSVHEIGLFEMDDKGLHGLSDPSEVFLSSRADDALPPGIAFTSIVEGSRAFVVELQALVVPARSGLQRIYSDKVDTARVSRVAAILERHTDLRLTDQDIYVNVAGGVKISDVSIELPLALALYSSRINRSLPGKLVSFGELSLAGEVRNVPFLERKQKAATDLGFSVVISPYAKNKKSNEKSISVKSVKSAITSAFALKA